MLCYSCAFNPESLHLISDLQIAYAAILTALTYSYLAKTGNIMSLLGPRSSITSMIKAIV